MKQYYYLHTNGELIYKNAYSVDSLGAFDYFDSDFVQKYWIIDTENIKSIKKMISEALKMNVNKSCILDIIKRFKINLEI